MRFIVGLTGVDEASRRSFAELLGLVGQRDLHDPGDVTRGRLDPDGVGGDQLHDVTRKHKNTHTQITDQLHLETRFFTFQL